VYEQEVATFTHQLRPRTLSDLADFFQVLVVAIQVSRPSAWFARTNVIVSGAVVQKLDECGYFFCRNINMLIVGYRHAMRRVRSEYKIATRSADLKLFPFPQTTRRILYLASAFPLRNDS
jgi:hypothetical protein